MLALPLWSVQIEFRYKCLPQYGEYGTSNRWIEVHASSAEEAFRTVQEAGLRGYLNLPLETDRFVRVVEFDGVVARPNYPLIFSDSMVEKLQTHITAAQLTIAETLEEPPLDRI